MNPDDLKFKKELYDKVIALIDNPETRDIVGEWAGELDLGEIATAVYENEQEKYQGMETWVEDQGALGEIEEPEVYAVCVNAVGLDFLIEGERYMFDEVDDDFIMVVAYGERREVFRDRFRIESV